MAFDVMDVFVKIGADTSDLENGISKTQGFVSGLGNAVGAGMKAVGVAVGAAATAVGALGTKALESYSSYEQLAGGVEKLYGTAADKIKDYADQAYMTSGMSANAYMETATSFSAALINSLEGDVDKAADMTDVAMKAMSDNVNVFGSDFGSVQNAFQGFAKQNYTMLDNLKLGYGGTKQEMERLIEDANEYRASIGETADLSIDSFADVVQAIQSVQEAQNIAGTTNKEAMRTIEGSATATKAAWENVITAIGRGEGLTDAMNGLVTALFGENEGEGLLNQVIPRIETIMDGIGDFIGQAAPFITNKIPELINKVVPSLINSGMKLLSAFGDGILKNLPMLVDTAVQIVNQIVTGIVKALPEVAKGAVEIIAGLANGITQVLPTLIPTIVQVVMQIAQTLVENVPLLLQAAVQLIQGLLEGIISAIPVIIEMLPTLIQSVVDALIDSIPILIDGTISLVEALVEALPQIITALIDAMPMIIDAVVNGLLTALPKLIEGHIRLVLALVQALPQIIQALVDAMPKVIEMVMKALQTNLPKIIQSLVQITGMIATNLPTIIVSILKMIPQIVSMIVQAILTAAPAIFEAVVSILDTVGSTLISMGGQFVSNVANTMSKLLSTVVTWLSQLPSKMAYWANTAITSFMEFVMELPGKAMETFNNVMENVAEFGRNFWEKATEIARNFFNNIVDGIKELPDKIRQIGSDMVDAIKDLPEKFKEVGKNIVEGIKNGISDAWGAFKEWFDDKINSLKTKANDILGIGSPSKVFAKIGMHIDEGLALGLKRNVAQVYNAMDDVMDAVSYNPGLSTVGSADVFNMGHGTNIDAIDGSNALVDAFVKALDRYGLAVEVDHRELGRVVRREVFA